jgi:hypothetical protein
MALGMTKSPAPPQYPAQNLSGALGSALGGLYGGGGGGSLGPYDYAYQTSPQFKQDRFRDWYVQQKRTRQQRAYEQSIRDWEAAQETKRFGRFRGLIDPLLEQYQGFLGSGGPQTQYDPNDPALLAMTGAIEQRGGEAQANLQSILAASGNIRAGALGEASARRIGETEALVAGKRGEFAQAASDRALREWEAKMNNYSSMLRELMGSYF